MIGCKNGKLKDSISIASSERKTSTMQSFQDNFKAAVAPSNLAPPAAKLHGGFSYLPDIFVFSCCLEKDERLRDSTDGALSHMTER